ncbi:MAG: hypothetical protein A3H67_01795 [Candidatus Buchananbacteria bacterium RIFCSPLOWO2_02_FULL_46_11b]|uniref:Uncharacterized protein n=1 Tax=Candidatus Buchananbacteria bacterium RIFCSPLOWO2_02_FULL_46_11b TaxID=1797548 RepID=A0A1G1YYQ7_9BACT|nr:MAG: hypothetical protein A3H67_01795 [Candidatus Buchananbacteria bacterium RIFCSPLOWO2_02_FULL_46_11b]
MSTTAEVLEKLRGLDGPTLLALVDTFPGERQGIDAVLNGSKTIKLEDAVRLLFDKNSRFIPFAGMESRFCDPAPKYRVSQPEINLGQYLEACRRFLPKELADTLMGQSEFEDSVRKVKARLEGDERTKNALKGPWFPVALPKMDGDYGAILDILAEAAKKAYEAAFPGRTFYNHRHETLAEQTSIVPGTRHDRLVEAVKEKSQAGIFLLPFGGFSIEACRETFSGHNYSVNIPEWLTLGGGWDTAMAYLAYSKVLCRNIETPIVRCAALNWQSGCSLGFRACDAHASFGHTYDLANAKDSYSAGVFCRG